MDDPTHSLFFYAAVAAIVLLALSLWSLKQRGRIPIPRLSPRGKLLLIAGAFPLTVLIALLLQFLQRYR
ncbi:hypothetical protein [Dongia sp.]|uniref:hypothetical protein n=1 Tax=Dongia sp. TaxID=1977262 RepID=UPI0037538537